MNHRKIEQNLPSRVRLAVRSPDTASNTPADTVPGRTVLYCRVSTADQTLAHQHEQARQAGFHIDEIVADHGVSGVSTKLYERSEGRRLFDILRAGDTLVVRWLDRLGRNYSDVTSTVRQFIERGVCVRTVINGMIFDGSAISPMEKAVRDSLLAFMAAIGEAQAEATKEAQKAGIAYAKKTGGTKYRGRKPTFSWNDLETVQNLLGQGLGISEIARATRLKRQTIYRIKRDPGKQAAALATWYPKSDEAGCV